MENVGPLNVDLWASSSLPHTHLRIYSCVADEIESRRAKETKTKKRENRVQNCVEGRV